jgi:protein SCO1/2
MSLTGKAVRVLGLACALAILLGCDTSAPTGMQSDADGGGSGMYRGAQPMTPMPMPDVTLRTVDGQPFNLVTDTSHPVTLVFFGYTNCPDVCPLVMTDLTLAYTELPAAIRAQTQVLFVTTDPARDTPSVLRSYLARYNAAFVGLTGDLPKIAAAATDLGVAITGRKKLPSGGYDVGHGAQVIGFSHESAPVVWTPGTSVPDMVADIETLAGS